MWKTTPKRKHSHVRLRSFFLGTDLFSKWEQNIMWSYFSKQPSKKTYGHVGLRLPFLKNIHPRRLTWNIIMEVWKMIFLSKWVICRFHVNPPGCIWKNKNMVLGNSLEIILSLQRSGAWKNSFRITCVKHTVMLLLVSGRILDVSTTRNNPKSKSP